MSLLMQALKMAEQSRQNSVADNPAEGLALTPLSSEKASATKEERTQGQAAIAPNTPHATPTESASPAELTLSPAQEPLLTTPAAMPSLELNPPPAAARVEMTAFPELQLAEPELALELLAPPVAPAATAPTPAAQDELSLTDFLAEPNANQPAEAAAPDAMSMPVPAMQPPMPPAITPPKASQTGKFDRPAGRLGLSNFGAPPPPSDADQELGLALEDDFPLRISDSEINSLLSAARAAGTASTASPPSASEQLAALQQRKEPALNEPAVVIADETATSNKAGRGRDGAGIDGKDVSNSARPSTSAARPHAVAQDQAKSVFGAKKSKKIPKRIWLFAGLGLSTVSLIGAYFFLQLQNSGSNTVINARPNLNPPLIQPNNQPNNQPTNQPNIQPSANPANPVLASATTPVANSASPSAVSTPATTANSAAPNPNEVASATNRTEATAQASVPASTPPSATSASGVLAGAMNLAGKAAGTALDVVKPSSATSSNGANGATNTTAVSSSANAAPRYSSKAAPRHAADGDIHLARGNNQARLNPQLQAAYEAYQLGDLVAARKNYQQVLLQEPNNRDALLGAAATAIRTGQLADAASFYLHMLELDPNDAEANAALVGLQMQDPQQAESRLKKILAQHPQSASLHFVLGNVYAQQERWSDAQQSYFRAFSNAPSNADYVFNLAVSLDRLGQTKLALEYYQRAISLAQLSGSGFSGSAVQQRIDELRATVASVGGAGTPIFINGK